MFVLGVGAQKGGTTWLRRQLQKDPHSNMGCKKEYHIWDAIYVDHSKGYFASPKKKELPIRAFRRLMQTQKGIYEAYFQSLITKRIRLTGDITPAYACLNESHFVHVKQLLDDAGFAVKVVFLMRDPVDRNWSSLRMRQRERGKRGREISDSELIGMFPSFYSDPANVDRTRYDRTVRALRNAFDEDDIYFGIYENLFSKDQIGLLSKFLGADLSRADVSERVNSSKPLALPEEERMACRQYFSEVYDFCFREFPQTRQLWK